MKACLLPALTRSFWPSLLVSAVCGALFGGGAALLYSLTTTLTETSQVLGAVNHLTSGTWLWAVAASLLTTFMMRRHPATRWRRYAWSFAICVVFLSMTTVLWYGFVTPAEHLPLLIFGAAVVCALPSAGIALVGAYSNYPGVLGFIARLCLPLGLTVILLVSPPPPLSYGGNAYSVNLVWWTLMALHALLACITIGHYMVSARTRKQNMTR